MLNKRTLALVVVEATVIGIVATSIYALLLAKYNQVQQALVTGQVTDDHDAHLVAALLALPTLTPLPKPTLTPEQTAFAGATLSPSITPSPDPSPTAYITVVTTAPPSPPKPSFVAVVRCDTISSPGSYRVTGDLVTSGDCIKVEASHVILDCDDHTLSGLERTGYGISIRKYGLLGTMVPTNVEIKNCKLTGFLYGIYAEGAKDLSIHDNDSSGNYDDTEPNSRYGKFLGLLDGGGIRFDGVDSSQVTANKTLHQAIGIDVRTSTNISITNNTSSDNSAWGINLLQTQNSQVSGNTTSDNVRQCMWGSGTIGWGCDAGGIAIQDGSNYNTITANSVTGRNGNGIFIKAHAMPCGNNNSIVGNTITGFMYNAVELGFCIGNRVDGNTMRDGLDGIWLGFAHDTEIKNNTIANMRNHGIISWNSRNNTISGNQIVNSNEGIFFYGSAYDAASYSWLASGDYTSHDNCLCSNLFEGNGTAAVHLKDSTFNQVTGNTFRNNARGIVIEGKSNGNNTNGNNYSFLWGPELPKTVALDHVWGYFRHE